MENKGIIRDFYEKSADEMREVAHIRAKYPAQISILNRIKRRLPDKPSFILDAGCDGGYYLTELSQLSHKIEVIEHLLKPPLFISEVNRVLKPEGRLILSTPYHGLIKNIAIALFKFEGHFKVEGAHIRFFTVKSLRSLLARYGFETERIEFIGRIPPLARSMLFFANKIRGV